MDEALTIGGDTMLVGEWLEDPSIRLLIRANYVRLGILEERIEKMGKEGSGNGSRKKRRRVK